MLPVEEDGLGDRTGGTGVSQIVTASLSESGMDWGFPGSHGTSTLRAKKSPPRLCSPQPLVFLSPGPERPQL